MIVSQGVVTLTMHTGSLQSTLVDVLLADVSSVPSVLAAAGVTIDSVSAVATVKTGGAGAVISVAISDVTWSCDSGWSRVNGDIGVIVLDSLGVEHSEQELVDVSHQSLGTLPHTDVGLPAVGDDETQLCQLT